MKTILVLSGGGETDHTVFDAALAVARPLGAHLEFLHVRLSTGEAAAHMPHVAYVQGAALREALDRVNAQVSTRRAAAVRHFEHFCTQHALQVTDVPTRAVEGVVSASWHEEHDDAEWTMIRCARRRDLVVLGRRTQSDGLPLGFLEQLLTGCGRPVLIAPPKRRPPWKGTVVVCWKDTPEAARAVTAALPLLAVSKRVVIVGAGEGRGDRTGEMKDLAQGLAWHGIKAEVKWLKTEALPVSHRLEAAADEYDADLLVMGGFGHSRLRETTFGGCTRHFIDGTERAVLLMH